MQALKAMLMMALIVQAVQPAIASVSNMHSLDGSVANETPMTIRSYQGAVDIKKTGETECQLSFEVTSAFELSAKARPATWGISSPALKATYAELDGKPVPVESRSGNFTLGLDQDIGMGLHRLKLKYSGTMNIFSPERSKLMIYAGPIHFHLFGGWFPICPSGYVFSDSVRFDFDFSLPKDWIILGINDPKLKGKPSPDGKYKIARDCPDPMKMEIAGGRYNQAKEQVGEATIVAYTLQNSKADHRAILKKAKEIAVFFEGWLDSKASGDFFIAETTGLKGCLAGTTGGLLADTAEFAGGIGNETLAAEISKMSWFGGNGVIGSPKKPDCRFFDESMPAFLALLYCKSLSLPDFSCCVYEKKVQDYFSSRNPGECAILDPMASKDKTVLRLKAPLVLHALKNYVGPVTFQNALREFTKKFSLSSDKKTRVKPEISDFKKMLEKHFGGSVDDFWNYYFKTGSLFGVDFSLTRSQRDGIVSEKVVISTGTAPPFPLGFKLYYADGEAEDIILRDAYFEKELGRPGGGIDFTDYPKIVPSPSQPMNTMGTSTIQAACSWKKPIVYCLKDDGPECVARAKELSERFGSELDETMPDMLPLRPVIITGKTAQARLGAIIKEFPIIWSKDALDWSGKVIEGSYNMFALLRDPRNGNTPIIVDTGMGEIPKDCTMAAYFEKADGSVKFSVDYIDSSGKFPEPALLDLPWKTGRSSADSSIYQIPQVSLESALFTYDGFDPETFSFGSLTKRLSTNAVNSVILNFIGGKTKVRIDHKTRFLEQTHFQELVCGKMSKIDESSIGFKTPAATTGKGFEASWNQPLRYLANIDGKTVSSWESGTGFKSADLSPGTHELKMVFLDTDGILSRIIARKIITGARPPKLEISNNPALYRDGTVTVRGRTDPGCTVDPPCTVGADGTFTLVLKLPKMQQAVAVKSTDSLGLSTSVLVSLVKYRKIVMATGSNQATDEDGNLWVLQVPPQSISGVTYVPMRFIGERLDAMVSWVEEEKKVVYMLGKTTVELWIGKTDALVNGQPVRMASPPVVANGRTLVPVRFVSEALGARVSWVPETKQIIVEYPQNID